MLKKRYEKKSPYEVNFFCFQIRDFKTMDSIIVYLPKEKKKVKGVVVDVDTQNNKVIFNTSNENSLSAPMNNIVFLKDYDKLWLE